MKRGITRRGVNTGLGLDWSHPFYDRYAARYLPDCGTLGSALRRKWNSVAVLLPDNF
ncbi:hypothetical protein [Methylomonas koyamae]|uniref:hypothetical protein n=1 Tax=Methylomonas koyamae TaxID=702114 RepID=UPI0028738F0F|nr:hypothetical protein [Methylomonas koyamae]WNB76450.1 hypothetical protein RI210_02425 [Methylomonas koyamae]